MRILQSLSLILVLAFVSGCAAPVPDDQRANIIAGLSITGYKTGLFNAPLVDFVTLNFQEYDPNSDELIEKGRRFGISFNCGNNCKDWKSNQYKVISVHSGFYVIRSIDHQIGRSVYSTQLVQTEQRKGIFGSSQLAVYKGSIRGRALPRFYFAAGRVAYIGEYLVDILRFPAKIQRITQDNQGAIAALTATKNSSQGFYFHPLMLARNPPAIPGYRPRSTPGAAPTPSAPVEMSPPPPGGPELKDLTGDGVLTE